MENSHKKIIKVRRKRVLRVRKRLRGNQSKPRLCVLKSNQHLYAQLIDDESGRTIVSASTLTKALRSTQFNTISRNSAEHIGTQIAQLAQQKGIVRVVFDRSGAKYHGLIAVLADAARKAGLEF